MIRTGPAGWSYDDWAGVVYPKPKPRGFDPLQFLADYFDTIEINSTFYRPPRPEVAVRWAERVTHNENFRFSAKLFRRFTHQRNEAWTRAEAREARAGFDRIAALGRLGAVLLQFPWSFKYGDESRGWLDDLVGTFGDLPLVVEVRHSSWNTPQFLGYLHERGVGLANIDQPLFKDSIKPAAHATAAVGYVRVHGRNYKDWWRESASSHERYDYLYPAEELKPWVDRALDIGENPDTEDVYIVTNNHYRGKAVANALMMESMASGEKVAGPPELFATYGDELAPFAEAGASREPVNSEA